MALADARPPPPPPSARALFLAFMGVALSGFGGVLPWARRMLVERRALDERRGVRRQARPLPVAARPQHRQPVVRGRGPLRRLARRGGGARRTGPAALRHRARPGGAVRPSRRLWRKSRRATAALAAVGARAWWRRRRSRWPPRCCAAARSTPAPSSPWRSSPPASSACRWPGWSPGSRRRRRSSPGAWRPAAVRSRRLEAVRAAPRPRRPVRPLLAPGVRRRQRRRAGDAAPGDRRASLDEPDANSPPCSPSPRPRPGRISSSPAWSAGRSPAWPARRWRRWPCACRPACSPPPSPGAWERYRAAPWRIAAAAALAPISVGLIAASGWLLARGADTRLDLGAGDAGDPRRLRLHPTSTPSGASPPAPGRWPAWSAERNNHHATDGASK